ncbi:hypothetical protein, conserved [Trypanosoma brucei gambiense DAL972]|uniref:Amidase domain-containing protein n=1 Tax=Trypanosoma brucei gambiense (strain MHOM/CI/86/DAL972) TaxID=679716 RepID=C9ZP65_TRYB9|nr:hypothetical protein, conserved [Trypanosoma brucei gambiense DAL972]CBH11193.1 hypothetical protein, conserved [Trypanosoma brucei gambiense DAL972]|eukprot:XP_011773480.1 hypothetical protein, conserved [Trypanosoma brucei gambiense DAL972]
MLEGLCVRKAVERLRHKTSQQRQLVNEMRERADALTASGLAAARARRDPAAQKLQHQEPCFVEVASSSNLQRGFSPDCMLSGVAIGVSDTLDVREFCTRYGTQSQLLQQMPQTEFPFVSWLRRHGAQFVGKLACRTPLTIDEASLIVSDNPAAVAVSRNACNYAISSSLMGPAALTSPLHHPIASFKPTAQSFATFAEGYRLSVPSMSFGITAGTLDDIFYLWEVFTSAIQPASFFDTQSGDTTDGNDGNAVTDSNKATGSTKRRRPVPSPPNDSSANRYGYASVGRFKRSISDGYSSLRGSRPTSGEEELIGPHIELSVGYPADWIDALCHERLLSADEFRRRILRLVSTRNSMRKNEVLEVIPLTIDIDLEEVVQATQTIGLYELSQAFDRLFFWNAHSDGRDPCLSSSSSTSGKAGVLEELPEELVSAIFNGRALTSLDYHRALRTRDSVVRATEEQFRDVDFILTPMLSEPYVNSSMRSIALLLPFSLGGNPMVSLQLEPDFPVVLIGELGRDTGLFEDSTTFLQFVQGTSPGWWRRKFMR